MSKMSQEDRKNRLIDWIQSIQDDDVLASLESFVKSAGTDWWDKISLAEQENILQGKEDMRQGKVLSSEDFWRSIGTPK